MFKALLISYFDTEQRPGSKRAPSTVSGSQERHSVEEEAVRVAAAVSSFGPNYKQTLISIAC